MQHFHVFHLLILDIQQVRHRRFKAVEVHKGYLKPLDMLPHNLSNSLLLRDTHQRPEILS